MLMDILKAVVMWPPGEDVAVLSKLEGWGAWPLFAPFGVGTMNLGKWQWRSLLFFYFPRIDGSILRQSKRSCLL